MSLTFTVEANPTALNKLVNSIKGRIIAALPVITKELAADISREGPLAKFRTFLFSTQFVEDFGIAIEDKHKMANNFLKTLQGFSGGLAVIRPGKEILISLFDQRVFKEITAHVWDNKSELDPKIILVNAWDIYEYGIIGGKNVGGTIRGFREIESKSEIQRGISRSGRALMIRNPRHNFSFQNGDAPRINAIRSFFIKNTEKFEKEFGRKILQKLRIQ